MLRQINVGKTPGRKNPVKMADATFTWRHATSPAIEFLNTAIKILSSFSTEFLYTVKKNLSNSD
jgi:hypothetical protein